MIHLLGALYTVGKWILIFSRSLLCCLLLLWLVEKKFLLPSQRATVEEKMLEIVKSSRRMIA